MNTSKAASRAGQRLKWLSLVAVIVMVAAVTWMVARATAPDAVPEAGEDKVASLSPHSVRDDTATTQASEFAPELVMDTQRSQLSYLRLNDGMRMGTVNEHHARAALSLSKLYIAYYVLEYGSTEDAYAALSMLTDSSDATAEQLFAQYPESIDTVAEEFGLSATASQGYWGTSVTSTYDVVTFMAQLIADSPEHPILVALSLAKEEAADGYDQNFGTARLSNVIGTKWGWSNDRSVHSSVSFGENFVVAAAVNGSARDLTRFVRNQVTAQNLREATTAFLEEREQEQANEE